MSSVDSSLDKAKIFHKLNTVNKDREALKLKRNSTERINEIESLSKDHAKVDIESRVKDFARIKSAVDQVSDIDNSDRINELKEKVENGSYQINYNDVSDIMLRTEY